MPLWSLTISSGVYEFDIKIKKRLDRMGKEDKAGKNKEKIFIIMVIIKNPMIIGSNKMPIKCG